MESVRSQSNGPVLQSSLSLARHYRPSSSSSSSSLNHASASAFSASAFGFNGFSNRSMSPTRPVNLRSLSPGRNMKPSNNIANNHNNVNVALPGFRPKRTCMCSPTNHPGSFRCSLHRNSAAAANNSSSHSHSRRGALTDARRSAMRNSLVRICAVEGDGMLKRALSSLIRPSSHQLRRRSDFRPALSRLSRMTAA